MNKEKTKELMNLAPYMFNYEGSNDITKSLISFGFECGDGWFELIKKLISDISELDGYNKVKVFQIKEKFGTLRFYIDQGSDRIFECIREAEKKSAITCEICGKPGTMTTLGWMKVLCDECKKERE